MEVAPPDRPRATLKVQSQVPNAEVFVDGSSLGRAPIDRNDLDPGKHYIVVHKDGFTDFKREVVLLENQSITMVADLSATGSRARPLQPGRRRGEDRRRADRQDAGPARRGVQRRSHRRVQAEGVLRPQGDDEDRGRPGEGVLGRPQGAAQRPDARAGAAAQAGDVVVRRQGEPGGRRDRGLRPRLPLLRHRPADGRRASPSRASTSASSSRPSSTSPTWR